MKGFIVGLVLMSFLAGGAAGYTLLSPKTTAGLTITNTACDSLKKEERRIIDSYTFLLSRNEIRQEEDRRSIEREFHDKFIAVVQDGEKKGCPIG